MASPLVKMKNWQRILIIADEPQISRVLCGNLSTYGYVIRVASDGLAALQTFGDWPPDLVIIDLLMSGPDGLQLCRNLRAISRLPIIILSARSEERAKVQALDAGADDYVTKPFGMDELLARIRAALRRAPSANLNQAVPPVLEAGDFRVDLETRSVVVRGREVRLTPKEYDLMVYLISHPGKVLTHRTLLAAIWRGDSLEQTDSLRVFVGQLRKKVEPEPAIPRYILTEPWIGYRFAPGS